MAGNLATQVLQGAAFYAQDFIRIIRVCSGGRHGHRAKHGHGYTKPGHGTADRHVHYAIATGDNNNPAWHCDNAAGVNATGINATKFGGNSADVAARLHFRKSGSYARNAGRGRQRWIGNRRNAEPNGHDKHCGSVHAVQQHQHRNLNFKYDYSEQRDLNNSHYIHHQQRRQKFQFNRSFSNSVAAQRVVGKRNLGNGSDSLHAGQQRDSSRIYFNRA